MNIFGSWKDTDVAAHNARVAAKRLGAGGQPITDSHTERASRPGCQPRPARPSISTDEAKLNKTERAFLMWARSAQLPFLHIQAQTLKLAHDCRLTVDFTYFDPQTNRFKFVDVKGFQREDALIKMKVAARMFPEYDFFIVKKDPNGWKFEEIKP